MILQASLLRGESASIAHHLSAREDRSGCETVQVAQSFDGKSQFLCDTLHRNAATFHLIHLSGRHGLCEILAISFYGCATQDATVAITITESEGVASHILVRKVEKQRGIDGHPDNTCFEVQV